MAEKNRETNRGHINGGFVQENGDEKVSEYFILFCKKHFELLIPSNVYEWVWMKMRFRILSPALAYWNFHKHEQGVGCEVSFSFSLVHTYVPMSNALSSNKIIPILSKEHVYNSEKIRFKVIFETSLTFKFAVQWNVHGSKR